MLSLPISSSMLTEFAGLALSPSRIFMRWSGSWDKRPWPRELSTFTACRMGSRRLGEGRISEPPTTVASNGPSGLEPAVPLTKRRSVPKSISVHAGLPLGESVAAPSLDVFSCPMTRSASFQGPSPVNPKWASSKNSKEGISYSRNSVSVVKNENFVRMAINITWRSCAELGRVRTGNKDTHTTPPLASSRARSSQRAYSSGYQGGSQITHVNWPAMRSGSGSRTSYCTIWSVTDALNILVTRGSRSSRTRLSPRFAVANHSYNLGVPRKAIRWLAQFQSCSMRKQVRSVKYQDWRTGLPSIVLRAEGTLAPALLAVASDHTSVRTLITCGPISFRICQTKLGYAPWQARTRSQNLRLPLRSACRTQSVTLS